MFLIIYEDCSVGMTKQLNADLFVSANDGYIDIVDMSKDPPVRYYKNEWHSIEEFK